MKKLQSTAIWLTATLFALYELFITNGFYGVSLALQQHDLNLPAGASGTLAAVASLIYAICQIPAGILVSRFSIKFILCEKACVRFNSITNLLSKSVAVISSTV